MKKINKTTGNSKIMAILLFTCIFLVLGGTAKAQEGFMAGNMSLMDQVFLENCSVEIYAQEPVDTRALMAGVEETDDSETIYEKIGANRQRLYPNTEIACIVTNNANEFAATVYIELYKSIYWWSKTITQNDYWYAIYDANVATLTTVVNSGAFYMYTYSNGQWNYKELKSGGSIYAAYVTGNQQVKGFGGIGVYGTNTTDIVMYFFR